MGGTKASHAMEVPNFSIRAKGCELLSNFKSACAIARLREPIGLHDWKFGGASIPNPLLVTRKKIIKDLLVDERAVESVCLPCAPSAKDVNDRIYHRERNARGPHCPRHPIFRSVCTAFVLRLQYR